jgi:hypothetical protein
MQAHLHRHHHSLVETPIQIGSLIDDLSDQHLIERHGFPAQVLE